MERNYTAPHKSSEDVLGLLADTLREEYPTEADKVESLIGKGVNHVREELTKIEQKPDLPAAYFGLVAAAKIALTNKEAWERFFTRAMKLQGFM